MQQNLVWKVIFILAVLGLCLYSMYPPSQKIRLGKDLKGGTSMVYLVNLPADTADKAGVLAQTITVLKERVNPQGVLDISMQPLGVDRIEIVMPLPNDEVKALRKAYDDALEALQTSAQISESDLDDALRADTAVQKWGSPGAMHAEKVIALQRAYDALQTARTELLAARTIAAATPPASEPAAPPATQPGMSFPGAATEPAATQAATQPVIPPSNIFMLEQRVADAQDLFETLRSELLAQNLDSARLVRAITASNEQKARLDTEGKPVMDDKGERVLEPSPRTVALDALKQQFPALVSKIDAVVAAYDNYQSQRTTLDDPEDLKRMLRGAGVLEFHIVVRSSSPEGVNIEEMRTDLATVGPANADSSMARWYPINGAKEWAKEPALEAELERDPKTYFANRYDMVADRFNGVVYVLLYTTPQKAMVHDANNRWTVESTQRSQDELGRAAVSFRLDPSGGSMMGKLTQQHIGQKMAIVLDEQVYSAPNLQSQIINSGIIQGDFSPEDIDYLIRVLAAGSLSARLSDQPIAVATLGPSLGADNLARGLEAFKLSILVTMALMMVYYFFAGFIANVALLANAIVIFGVMAMIDGAFTLPGLAGIALAVAMAVDANVLIYERIREEVVNNHEDLRTAIRLGYNRAMSAIIDGNVTHLITCVVLLYTATTEVKGFALTMILGVVATLFTALFITRVLYIFYTDYFHAKTLPMLPTVFPAIHKALTPNVDWIRPRRIFFTISALVTIASLALVASLGSSILDTEFRGGAALTMRTRAATQGEAADSEGRLLLSRPEVEAEIHAIGEAAGPDQPAVQELTSASVLTVGEMTSDYKASRFQIKVSNPPGIADEASVNDVVQSAIAKRFSDRIDSDPELNFTGREAGSHNAYTFPIDSSTLGANIQQPDATQSVGGFRGGVAIVLKELSPPVSIERVKDRIKRLREQPDFIALRGRTSDVFGLRPVDPADPSKGYTELVVVAYDPGLDLRKVDAGLWDDQLARTEWNLVSTALSTGSSFQETSSFSSAIARTLAANAVVAVVLSLIGMLVYIWVRFGSLRYSVATVVAVAHNVTVCLGALALTHYVAKLEPIASWLMLQEFRIDLNVIAALLTIIGYSLNDTIVILDRIRENRGKRLFATPEIVNKSINQTFSRTILTGGSTIMASLILYILGGPGLQPFAFTFLVGLIVGTYSSVAIAAPMVVSREDEIRGSKGLTPQASPSIDAAATVAA